MQVYKGNVKDIFNPSENYTFLVGAGISMESPSNLPSATDMMKVIVNLCAPKKAVELIIGLYSLRFENLIEYTRYKSNIDKNVEFLDYFDAVKSPNLIHLFLAKMIIMGEGHHHIITTNFDYLIEYALKLLLESKDHNRITPIITKEDFSTYMEQIQSSKKKHFIYKVHGSKKNIISDADTSDSLITDTTSLGKNRIAGQTFAMETFKKPIINTIMKGQTIVVMGYSGGDDFDITPMLYELDEIKKIIWIDHEKDDIQILRITHNKQSDKSMSDTTKFSMLREIVNMKNCEAYIVKINTHMLVKDYLDPIFTNGQVQKLINKIQINNNRITFSEWLSQHKVYMNISYSSKLFFAGWILQDFGKLDNALELYFEGVERIEGADKFLNNIGSIYLIKGEYDKALKYFEAILIVCEKVGNLLDKAICLGNIGMIYKSIKQYDKALKCYKEGLLIAEKTGDIPKKARFLNNIGGIFIDVNQYDDALSIFINAIEIYEKIGDLSEKATCLNNLGYIYYSRRENEKALGYYNESLSILEKLGDMRKLASTLSNIGEIHKVKGNYNQALKYYEKALKIDDQIGNLKDKAGDLNNIALIYFSEFKNAKKALHYMEQCLQIHQQINSDKVKEILNIITFLKTQI